MDGYHHHHHHHGGSGGGGYVTPGYAPPGARYDGGLPPQPTVRIFCKANENYSLAVRDGHVVLATANPNDDYQHWIKDMRHSTSVKDEEGYPAFALINKVTGQALKHSLGQSHPVRAVPYNPQVLDESVLWTESRDVGHGFRCIRMVNNIYLNFDAFHGDKDHGGVHDGTSLVLWKWCEGDNQRWKIERTTWWRFYSDLSPSMACYYMYAAAAALPE
ncbi:hypothetical protein ACMD2_04536 [Ananas comosus]|uniref:PH domain-containing protein n=1 Tax=Ananas comosus TaxID=4615 RepID=A0A199VGR1_ANACO|nr:hypothetical protein ACMD2_04536 [Ananas comosus]